MAEYRAYVGLDVHKDTMAAAVAWPGREAPEYRGLLANRSSSLKRLIRHDTVCTGSRRVSRGGRCEVTGRLDGGRMSSDGGALLLRDADTVVDLTGRIAACFDDCRDPTRTEPSVEALVRQRVFGLALGYEDLNDHDEIRRDSMLALAGSGDHGPRRFGLLT